MDGYISFSQLNDFLYSPMSLYLHECYKQYATTLYDDTPQIAGKKAHQTIDTSQYKKKHWITGMWLSSDTLGIYGKLDLYNEKTGALVERKRTIKHIYDGYKMQVWGQYYCLIEMGYPVSGVFLHSLTDNTRYSLGIPTDQDMQQLKSLVEKIRGYQPSLEHIYEKDERSGDSIYASLVPKSK